MGVEVQDVLFIESKLSQGTVSLDKKLGSSEDSSMIKDVIPDKNVLLTDESTNWRLIAVDLLEEIHKIVSPKEFEILRMRFGLQNGSQYTLEEIGKMYGVTRERVRQLEAMALARLRGSNTISRLINETFGKEIPQSFQVLAPSTKAGGISLSPQLVSAFLQVLQRNISKYIPQVTFREGQSDIYYSIIENLKKGTTSMYIEGPTGIGKTFIEALVADAILATKKGKILLLTSRIDSFEFIRAEFNKFVPKRKVSIYGAKDKDLSGDVVVMSYAIYAKMTLASTSQFKTLLLDDAHKSLGKKVFEKLSYQKSISVLIGFTSATNSKESKKLQSFLGTLAYRISIREAIELGMLCAVQFIMASVDISIKERQKSESITDYNNLLSEEIIHGGGNIAAARLFRDMFLSRNLRGVMFALTISQGQDLVNTLLDHGIKARLVDNHISYSDRKKLFESFSNHEFDVLVSIDLLKESFNDPGVAVSMFVYPTQSTTDIIGGNGRVLRIEEGNESKLAYIVMFNFKNVQNQKFYHELVDGLAFIRPRKTRVPVQKDPFLYDKILGLKFKENKQINPPNSPESFIGYDSVDSEISNSSKDNDVLRVDALTDFSEPGNEINYDLVSKEELEEVGVGVKDLIDVSVDHEELSKISQENNFTQYLNSLDSEKRIQEFKARMLEHELVSLSDVMNYGVQNFEFTSFGKFGMGADFASLLLNKKIKKIDTLVLRDVCKALSLTKSSKEEIVVEV